MKGLRRRRSWLRIEKFFTTIIPVIDEKLVYLLKDYMCLKQSLDDSR